MRFELGRRVRFGECDPVRIVYYPHLLNWFNLAWEELLAESGLPLRDALAAGYGMPVKKIECEFYAPLEVDDRCTVALELLHVGTCSVEGEFTVVREDGTLAAKGRDVRVWVRCSPGEALSSVPIPENVREKLIGYLKG